MKTSAVTATDLARSVLAVQEAVTLSGIADMGPMLPQLSNIGSTHAGAIRAAAQALLAHDKGLQ